VFYQEANHALKSEIWYGSQPGDGEMTISGEDQQVQIVQVTTELLELVSSGD